MNLTDIANFRYSTKDFDTTKKISDVEFQELLNIIRLSPSSTNTQPWKFIIANTEDGKKRVAKSTTGFFSFNESKILNASHVIVFAAKDTVDDDYLLKVLNKEQEDGRFAEQEHRDMVDGARKAFANIHRNDLNDEAHWLQKQVYLNMGVLLLGAGALGIDALPMEGVDLAILDDEFNLKEDGYSAIGAVSLGYRTDSDFNSSLPKSRLDEKDIFTWLK